MKVTVITIVIGGLGSVTKGELENNRSCRDYPNYAQNTEKSPGYSRRLAVVQSLVKNNFQTLKE